MNSLAKSIKITFLGTGTSQGVPVIACNCAVCLSKDKRDKRLRSAILIESETTSVIIDTGPDFRYQMLREDVKKLDAVVFTHEHKDHIAGLDDIRAFNFQSGEKMKIFATERVQAALKREFSYVFADFKYPGIPEIELHTIDKSTPFQIGDIILQPIEVMHYKLPVLGFRINDFTYITDANFIAEEELQKIYGSKIIVLNALRKQEHISHFNLAQAIEMMEILQPEKGYFTHISHLLGKHEDISEELPQFIELAHDGLQIHLP